MTRRRRLLGSLALAVALCAGSAGAQHRDDEPREARQYSRRGAELQAAGRHEEAIEAFRSAGLISRQPRYLALIGLNEAALNRWVAAYRDLHNALGFGDDPWIARNRATLEAELARVRGHVAWIRLQGSPAGASVSVNGVAAGALPLRDDLLLSADEPAQLELSAEDHATDRRIVSLTAGEITTVEMNLQALAAHLRVSGAPAGAWVSVDGGAQHPAQDPVDLAAGRHDVRVGAPRYVSRALEVTVRPGQTVDVEASLEREQAAEPPPVAAPIAQSPAEAPPPVARPPGDTTNYAAIVLWGGLGVGVAASVATGIFVALGSAAEGEYNDMCRGPAVAPASCVALRVERQAQLDTYGIASIISVSVAGVGFAAAIGSLLRPNSGRASSSAGPRLLIGASGVGVRVTW